MSSTLTLLLISSFIMGTILGVIVLIALMLMHIKVFEAISDELESKIESLS